MGFCHGRRKFARLGRPFPDVERPQLSLLGTATMSRVLAPLAAVAMSVISLPAFVSLSSGPAFAQQAGGFGGEKGAAPGTPAANGTPGANGTHGANGTPPANEVTEFQAALRGVRGNVLIVKQEDGTEAQVMIPDHPAALTFVAEAEMAFLRPGMAIRFEVEFDRGGIPTGPVDKIEIFHPPQSRRMTRAMRERFVPGLYPKDDQLVPQAGPAMYRVVGNVAGMDESGALILRAGTRPVRVALTEEPKLEIRFHHLNLARPDDTVEVAGFFQPPDETRIKAERVTVKSDRVFGEQDDQAGARRETRDRSRPGGSAAARPSRGATDRPTGGRDN